MVARLQLISEARPRLPPLGRSRLACFGAASRALATQIPSPAIPAQVPFHSTPILSQIHQLRRFALPRRSQSIHSRTRIIRLRLFWRRSQPLISPIPLVIWETPVLVETTSTPQLIH